MIMNTLKELLEREQRHLAEAQRFIDAARTSPLVALVQDRIEIGKALEGEVSKAKSAGVPWADWCGTKLPVNQVQADKYRRVYAAREQALELAKLGELPAALNNAVRLLPAKADSEHVANQFGGGKDRDSDHWITPREYTEAAREVMGGLDFDPFSSPEANELVGAAEFYTEKDDAFTMPWPKDGKTVWMNPPYGRGNVAKAVEALLKHLPRIDHAVVLVNNATETQWFQALWDHPQCSGVVFTTGRIAFVTPGDKALSGNTRGQVFVYFGRNTKAFCEVFSEFGKFLEVKHGC